MKQRTRTGDGEWTIGIEGLKEKRSMAETGRWVEGGDNKFYIDPRAGVSRPEAFEEIHPNQNPFEEAA